MARQLTFQIVAETYEAEAKLRLLETQIQTLNKDVEKGTITWEEYEKQLKSTATSAAAQKQPVEELKKGTQQQTTALGALQSAIMRYAGPAGVAYAVKQSMAWADQLDELSVKSGIGIVQLQKLSVAGARSGVSIEQISNASAKLLRELGDPKAGGLNKALSQIGINVEKFRALDPAEAFETLAVAVAKLKTPQEQINALTDVFGERMARTLRPALLEVAKGLDGIATASPETVRNLAAANDVMGDLWHTGKVLLADVIAPFAPALTAIGEAAAWAGGKLSEFMTIGMQWGADPLSGLVRSIRDIQVEFGAGGKLPQNVAGTPWTPTANAPLEVPGVNTKLEGSMADPGSTAVHQAIAAMNKQARETIAAAKKAAKEARKDLVSTNALRLNYLAYGLSIPSLTPNTEAVGEMYRQDLPILRDLGLMGGLTTAPNLKNPSGLTLQPSWLQRVFGGGQGLTSGLTSTMMGALMGGGSVSKSLGGFFGSTLGNWGGNVFSTGASVTGGALGKVFGALGSAIPIIGSFLGPAIGGLFGKLFGGGEAKQTKAARTDFIAQFGGLDELRKQADLAGFSLSTLLTTKKTKTLEREIQALNKALEETKKRVAAITTGLDELSRSGGLISQGLISQIQRDIKNPEVQQAVASFMQQQTQTAVESLNAYLSEAQILTVGGAEAMSGAIVATFKQLRDEGKTTGEALALLEPSIKGLRDKLLVMGLDGGGAFEELARLAGIANSEVTGPWVQNAGTLNTILTALTNLGLTDPAIFAGIATEITAIYDKLISLNVAPRDALILLQQPLQTLWQMQHDFGLKVDDSTQKLIDQGLEAGVIGEQFKSAQDKMIEAVNALILRLDRLITQLGGEIPTAIDQLPDSVDIPVNFVPGKPIDPDLPGWGSAPAAAAGGIVRRPTFALVGEAGPEAIIPLDRAGGLLGGVTVNVDARGALLNDPGSQQSLASIISDAVTRQLSLRTRYAVA